MLRQIRVEHAAVREDVADLDTDGGGGVGDANDHGGVGASADDGVDVPIFEPFHVFACDVLSREDGDDGVGDGVHGPIVPCVRYPPMKPVWGCNSEWSRALGLETALAVGMSEPTREQLGPTVSAEVLARASRGEAAAWEELVRVYSRRVYALAKSRCHNADVAEEITQSVFATLATKLKGGEYQERGRFESWLFRVAMNRVRDHVRRAKRRLERGDLSHAEGELVARSGEETDTRALARLREAMEQLSEQDREVVELRHHGQMSFQDMADLLEEPLGTLLARHHRALRKLRELIEGTDEGEQERPSTVGGKAR